ncbi:putative membrane protein [Acinetobacter baumannii 1237202]|nr:putative membrane protein [Acinetobacter baumannii 1237202]
MNKTKGCLIANFATVPGLTTMIMSYINTEMARSEDQS